MHFSVRATTLKTKRKRFIPRFNLIVGYVSSFKKFARMQLCYLLFDSLLCLCEIFLSLHTLRGYLDFASGLRWEEKESPESFATKRRRAER